MAEPEFLRRHPPYLVVSDCPAAIVFYQAAFGAIELNRSSAPHSEKLMHTSSRSTAAPSCSQTTFPSS